MRALLAELVDLVLPACCARCTGPVREREALCNACAHALHPIDPDACLRCQTTPAPSGQPCLACAAQRGPLDACLAEVWFEGETPPWIRRAKYPRPGMGGLDPAARAVFLLLAERAAARVTGPPPDCVVPVPLHARALRRRGFNPSALLGRHLARQYRTGWDPVALTRLRDTPSQTGLSRTHRRDNVAAAFQARRRLAERIWLVDDVVTTGATLAAAAMAARAAGAREIVAICAARTPAPGREAPPPAPAQKRPRRPSEE